MIRLTREVRFSVDRDWAGHVEFTRPITNSWAGWPSAVGLVPYLRLRATLAGDPDPRTGYLCNISVIDDLLRRHAIPFAAAALRAHGWRMPAEHLLEHIWGQVVREAPPRAPLVELALWPTPFLHYAIRREQPAMILLTQQFEFSAAHRLHVPQLSDAENRQTFGKCNNPRGHGHNYLLEVTVAGAPDARQGVVLPLPRFEQVVQERIIQRFDHKHLNEDTPEFRDVNPSAENIARGHLGFARGSCRAGAAAQRARVGDAQDLRGVLRAAAVRTPSAPAKTLHCRSPSPYNGTRRYRKRAAPSRRQPRGVVARTRRRTSTRAGTEELRMSSCRNTPSRAAVLLLGAVTFLLVSMAGATDMGQAAANAVSQSSYQNYLNTYLYTHTGNSRGAPNGAQHNLARDNIKSLMESYGLSVALESFSYGGTGWNVVGTKTGTLYPDKQYIIGCHYDSVNNPGADDNASGAAGVLEAARVLSQYPSEYTIKFIAFDMEELGLIGSEAYVNAHPGVQVLGMISLDMICYDPNTNHALLYGRTTSNPIKQALANAISEYGGLTYTIAGQLDASDHAPFEAAGYQACLLIEGAESSNPYYHTQNDCYDTPGYLNFAFATKMTRGVVGWLVDQAHVIVPVDALTFGYPDGRPDYSAPNGTTRVRVTVTGLGSEVPRPGSGVLYYDAGAGWHTAALLQIDPDTYDAYLPRATCGGTLKYYFNAQSMSGRTYADPYHAPDEYYGAHIGYGLTAFYQNNFDADPRWITEPLWGFGRPLGQGGQYGGHDPNSGHTGTNVYGYNLSGDYENNLPEKNLTSLPIDCTGRYGVTLNFWRWLGVEQPQYDHAYVRASNNGTAWTTVWQNPSEVADTAWQEMNLDISAVADNQPAVYLRWTMGTTDGAWQYCGWNIDDVSLTMLNCTAPYRPGDVNCDSVVDFLDINPFVLALTDPAGYVVAYPNCSRMYADVNEDGIVDFNDINPFVALLQGN